ncbi:hypothetical protein CONPUDRAFT_143543 [Coniophora puteana RWD-64-598 SS2]|uniref:F-box domain-containing protein n=1 Tax=Coniophora puteana (strain RWD-64-598) TaxID=741705 RepID=A0A5M3MS18_CONPW|nr:uncharacterized protein CONPUDRAFT_143543 [Coniophora puteana RWD-64-598 SS2]EIW81943.1 hypothetical protein CONPUDRAFT_143543 [Coniophora puteana RWD-64-598 SS2]
MAPSTSESLPPELLSAIFAECIAQAHDPTWSPWHEHRCDLSCIRDWSQVTLVCRYWRSVALSTPSLWCRLPGAWFYTKTMLARADTLPLSISTLPHPKYLERLSKQRRRCEVMGGLEPEEDAYIDLSNVVTMHLGRIRELVVPVTAETLPDLMSRINRGLSAEPRMLESLSLHYHDSLIRSVHGPTDAEAALPNAPQLKRLHIYNAPPLAISPSMLDGMHNLRELSLSRTMAALGDLSGHRIYLPRLARLNLEDPIDLCQHFIEALHLRDPLEYIGIEPPRWPYYESLSNGFPPLRDIFLAHHVLGQSQSNKFKNPDTPLDLSAYHTALGISTRRKVWDSGTSSTFYFGATPAPYPNAPPSDSPGTLSALRERITTSDSRCAARADLSHPGLFASAHALMPAPRLLSAVARLFPVADVVSLDISAGRHDPAPRSDGGGGSEVVSPATLRTILAATPRVRYLRTCKVRLEDIVAALHPYPRPSEPSGDSTITITSSYTALLPSLKSLALDDIDFLRFGAAEYIGVKDMRGRPLPQKGLTLLAPCLARRVACGFALEQLEIRRESHLRDEERAALEELRGVEVRVGKGPGRVRI